MKKTFRIVALIVLLSSVLGMIVSHPTVSRGAVIYGDAYDLILASFREENKVSGAKYLVEYCIDGYEETEVYKVKNAPSSRTFIIADSDTYDAVFKKSAIDIDFEKEMILLCTFSAVSQRECFIDRVSVKDGKARIFIHLKLRLPGIKDGVQSYQRWVAVKMRKADITDVVFYEWRGISYQIV